MDLAQLALLHQPPRLEALVAEVGRVVHHEGKLRRGGGGGGGERARLVDTEIVILLGLARRTANKSEKVSLFYYCPTMTRLPAVFIMV